MGGQVFALLLALVTVGIFAGASVFHQTALGDAWLHETLRCTSEYGQFLDGSGDIDPVRHALWLSCMTAATTWLVVFEVGFLVVAVLATAVASVLGPSWVAWRRRWRPLPPELEPVRARVEELAAESGVRRPPTVLLGAPSLRDALTTGSPGRYAIVVPRKLALSAQTDLFEATIRHELAHVRRHDVLVAWSTRPAIRVTAALLLIPVIGAVIDRDPSLLPGYLWRAAFLLVATTLMCAAILRAREFEADALASTGPVERAQLLSALDRARPSSGGRWRRAGAFHPQPDERRRALLDPARGASPRLLDSLAASLLVAVAVPLLRGVVADNPLWTPVGTPAVSLLAGLVLGSAVGGSLWAAAYTSAAVGVRWRPTPAVVGVLLGFCAGPLISLASSATITGLVQSGPSAAPGPPLLAGATALVAGCAGWSAQRRQRVPGAVLRVLVASLSFIAALAVAASLGIAVESGGVVSVRAAFFALAHPTITGVTVALTICLWLLVAGGGRRLLITVAVVASVTGTVSLAVLAGYRLVHGRAVTDADAFDRFLLVVAVLAATGLVAAIPLLVRYGQAGWAPGLVAGSLALAMGGTAFTIFNAVVLNAPISWATVVQVSVLPQGAWYLACALAAVVSSLLTGVRDVFRRD